MNNRLYRCKENRMIAGVCGGLANYFEIDPLIFRLCFAVLGLYGIGIVAYAIAWVIIPEGYMEQKPAKKLFRSKKARVLAGVCGGIAEYFNIDPVLVRLIAIILFFFSGFGIITYILAWIIIPLENINS